MTIIYIDASMGAAGDMLNASLYSLLDDDRKKQYLKTMNSLGLKDVKVEAISETKNQIQGIRMAVEIHGIEEGYEHESHSQASEASAKSEKPAEADLDHIHDHIHEPHHSHKDLHDHVHEHTHDHSHDESSDHGHHHDHHHTGFDEIRSMIHSMPVSDAVKRQTEQVYRQIAEAESRAHGKNVCEVHFHEVGMLDALADITGFCLLIEMLKPEEVICSPVCTGFGHVLCAHGTLPVPAPATAFLLEGIPTYAGNIEGELCTPTGAALLKTFVSRFEQQPLMKVEKTGYGFGKKDFRKLNAVRSVLGVTAEAARKAEEAAIESSIRDTVYVLSTNIDDMTAEQIGYAMDLLLENGALDVCTVPCLMKKSRPGTILNVICRPDDREKMARLIFKHTSTIGIRESRQERYILKRQVEKIETPDGVFRIKRAEGYGISRAKPEFEDLAVFARLKNESLQKVAGYAMKYIELEDEKKDSSK